MIDRSPVSALKAHASIERCTSLFCSGFSRIVFKRVPGFAGRVLLFVAAILQANEFGKTAAAQIGPILVPSWSQQIPANSPSARISTSMAYDSAHRQVVLFGGGGNNDTWLWNGANWSQANPATSPPPRGAQAMAYDSAHGQVVMFGGIQPNSATARLGDTWLWNGTTWTQASVTNGPPARDGQAMTYDPVHGQVVMFGGIDNNGAPLNDTWLWNGRTWAQANVSGPSNRYSASMAYDSSTNQTVLFGGEYGGDLGDTWVWNGSAWTQQSLQISPPARQSGGMVDDPGMGLLLFGGATTGGDLNDTWIWSGTSWYQYATSGSPSTRELLDNVAYDTATGQVVLFGGYNGSSVLGDTWTFGLPGNFNNVNVCPAGTANPAPCSNTVNFNYSLAAPLTFSTPQVVTQGNAGLDYTLNAAGTTCTGFVSGSSCSVSVTFAPLAPGSRAGSIQLTGLADNNSTVTATTPIYGAGQGPAVAFAPGTLFILVPTGLVTVPPKSVAVDAAGNVFVSDSGNQRVVRIALSGVISTVVSGLTPDGLTVDGAGNLLVIDSATNRIVQVPAGCTTTACQTTVGVGLVPQGQIAVDGAGDVFTPNLVNAVSTIVEIPVGCSTNYCQSVVYNGGRASVASGVAVDVAGDLFIADSGLGQVIEIPAGCTNAGCRVTVGAGWVKPVAVAVDAAGDVFVSDTGLNAVYEVPAGCTAAGCTTELLAGAGLSIAADARGNLFFPGTTLATVYELDRSQGPSLNFAATNVGGTSSDSPKSVKLQNIGNQALNAVSPGFLVVNGPNFGNVAGSGTPADCSTVASLTPGALCNLSLSFTPQTTGNPLTSTAVFNDNALNGTAAQQTISLSGTGASINLPLTVTLTGSGTGSVYDSTQLISCSLATGQTTGNCSANYSSGSQVTLTVNATGTSTFSGWGGVCASAGTNPTCSFTVTQAGGITASFVNQSFGSVNVCPVGVPTQAICSHSLPVTYNLPSNTTVGAIRVVTQGAAGLDFTAASGNTCVGTVAGSCTVNVNFAPLAPGLRMGAVQLYDNNGNLLQSTPIYGIGQEPEIAFGPGTQAVVNTTANYPLSRPKGVAVDALGDLFIADPGNQQVVKVAANGTVSTVGFGLSNPLGLAVDGAGALYIADSNLNQVVEVPAGCSSSNCQLFVGRGLRTQQGVAVDGPGNVFISDSLDHEVVEVSANGGAQTVVYNPGGTANPAGLATDAAGNLFITDVGLAQVVEIPAGCVSANCAIQVGSGWSLPEGVAVDAAGDVFVADLGIPAVVEVPAGCTSSACQIIVANGVGTTQIAVDAKGTVLIPEPFASQVVGVVRSLVPALSFAQTNVGSTSVDIETINVQNIGNQALTGSVALNLNGNFPLLLPSNCSLLLPLAPGASCKESFSFAPQSANFSLGTVTFTDNNLNLAPATQTITLSGSGAVNGVPSLIPVPNVVGQVQAAAATPITSVGLAMGTVTTASSNTVPAGSIIDQSPAAGTQVTVGSAVNLLVSTGIAQPATPNPLVLENNYFVTGDYISAGVTLRGTGRNNLATGTITIPSYAQSPTGGVPDGADIVDAFLYWETLESTPTASSANGTFNGYSIQGQQIGNDIASYKDGNFTGTLRVYRAAVNAYLPAQPSGIRLATGSYTVSLPDSGGGALPLTEGASLVMVYRVLSPNFPLKSVVLYDGAALATASSFSSVQVMQGFYDAVGGANGTGKSTNLFATASASSPGTWSNSVSTVALGQPTQYNAPLTPGNAYAAVILSTPVNNSDNDGILDAWKTGPTGGDFHAGQPGYYDAKTATWVGLPGAKHGQKDLFVQMDYMCGALLANGSCDPTKENLFPSPDTSGNDPLAMVQKAFAASGVQLHLQVGNAIPEDTCIDNLASNPASLCQFPNQPGVVGWKNSLEFSKLWPRNFLACITGGDCTTRFPYGQKDSYHYVLFGHSLAIPAWNSRYGTLASINVLNGVTTIVTADRGTGINFCPTRFTLSGVLGNPALNGVYNTRTPCPDSKTIVLPTPGVPNWSYPNANLPEPLIGLTSGTTTSISGYSDLGGSDSAVTLGLWLTAPNQDMSKKANVVAGTLFHEIGHTLGLSHGGLYYDTAGSYIPTFEANCKPNYQSVMNYLFQLDLVGPNQAIAFSSQTLNPINENAAASTTSLTDAANNPAAFPTSAWYVPYAVGSPASPATRHCDGTPLNNDSAYRVDASIAPITPPWTNGQDLSFIGSLQTERGFNDLTNMDLRQIGATGGEFASLATVLSFGPSVAPLNISAGGNVALGSGGTIALGSGGTVTLGSGGNVTLGSGGTITLGSGGNVTLGSGGNVTLGSGGTVTPGSSGTVTLGSGGNVTLGSGGTITLGSGGTITLGSGGNVTLGSGGIIALGSGASITVPASGGSYAVGAGGIITLGSGGNVTLGSGGNVTLGSGGIIALGSGGNVTLGSGGNVTLGSGGTITLGSGGNVTLGSGGNVTLGSGGIIALGSGGTVTLGSGGNVTLGSGGTVTLGSGGNVTLGSGGNVTLGSGGEATLGAGGTVTLGSGGNVTLGSGGNVTLGSGGTITLGSGGNVTLGSGGTVTLGSGGTITLGSGGNITLGSGGNVTLGSGGVVTDSNGVQIVPPGGSVNVASGGIIALGSGGNVTLGSGGNVTLGSGGIIALGSGGNVTLGSGGNVTLGSGGTITLGSGGTVTLGSGGNVTLGSGGVVTLGSGGSVTLGSGSTASLGSVPTTTSGSGGPIASELNYETANSVVRPPTSPVQTSTPAGVRITWNAPAFGVVQTYTIYRSVNGANPIVIGSVSGVNGNPPATEFTDTNPVLSGTVVYTISTTLVADPGGSQRQSAPSAPATLKNDQSIVLAPLPSSVLLGTLPTVTATAMSGSTPNGLQVNFTAAGSCVIGTQSIANKISSAVVTLTKPGSCTVTASQPGATTVNPANSVSGTFLVLPQGSGLKSQTINFAALPSLQYGNTFTPIASSSSGMAVTFTASGPCTTAGTISGVGICAITASTAGNSTYTPASLTQSFTIYPAVLKVIATSLSVAYGQPLPALTSTYSGFVNNDSPSVITGTPFLSTTATSTSNAGAYPITVSTGTLATPNYSFLYVNGLLTVQPASQSALLLKSSSPLLYNQSETLSVTGGTTGGAVTYNATGACTINVAQLTAKSGTGTCQVTATMAGSTNYNPVISATASIALLPASQAITFTTSPPASAAYTSTFTVAATGGASANPVVFTSAGACSNSGAVYTITSSTGTCSVIANQAGNANYAAAATVTKSVTASGSSLTVSTAAIDFGTVYQGSISIKTITLTNTGTAPVTINDPILSIVRGGNSNEFVALSLCPKPLAAGKSCTVAIGFIAGPYYTPQTATLQIMSNAPGSPYPVTLTASVINPRAAFNLNNLSFGTVKHGTTSTLNVTFSNPGTTPLSIANTGVTGANAASFTQTNTCGASLAAGASCTVMVRFTPPAAGKFSGALTFIDNASTGTQSIPLSGTGN